MATITTRAGKGAALTHQEVDANFTGLNTELGQKEVASNKGIANGYASLDSAGKVPSAQLPSYVDDVVEVANFASLPGTGETGKIYVTIDTNKTYRWTGSTYIEISASPGSTDSLAEGSTNLYFTQARARSSVSASGSLSYNSSTGVMSFTDAVTSVAGRSGAVTLTSSDVSLGNVENKSSATIRGEITSGNVTTALGYTPYNATNPSGYITSSALSSYLPLSGGTLTGTLTVGADGGGANFVQRAVNGWQDVLTVWRGGSNVWNLQDSSGSAKVTSGSFFIGSNLALHAGNYTSYSPSLTGSGASGTWGINITGNAATVSSITGNTGLMVNRLTPTGAIDGLTSSNFRTTLFGSGGNAEAIATARWNTPPSALSGLGFYGTMIAWAASDTHGFLAVDYVNGSARIGGGNGQSINWGALLLHSSNYTNYSPSLTGSGASGTWGIRVTGFANQGTARLYSTDAAYNYDSANPYFGYLTYDGSRWLFQVSPGTPAAVRVAYADSAGSVTSAIRLVYNDGPRDLSDRRPDSFTRTVNFDFVGAGAANGTGNFGGVMTYSPWTGTTASTGDSSYQLAFANNSGLNASGQPKLSIRNGIDATWNAWYTLLHSGNYTSYALPLSGGTLTNNLKIQPVSEGWAEGLSFLMPTAATWGGIRWQRQRGNYDGNWAIGYTALDSTDDFVFVANNGGSQVNNILRLTKAGVVTNNGHQILNASNYTSYSPPYSGGTLTGLWYFQSNRDTTSNSPPLQAYSTGGAGAIMSFHRGGSYAINMGLDSDNVFRIGGWSAGNNRLQMDMSGNLTMAGFVRATGNVYIDQNYGHGHVGLYESTRYQGVFFMGDAYKMSADGTSLANMYGIGWSHPNAGGAAGNLTDHGMLIINNGSFRCAISNSIVASGNITAYSDERLKRNWRDMPENFVERLAQVRVGCYERIDDGTQQVGVSAQSLQPLLPEAIQIAKDEIGTLSVSYGNAAMASAVELAKELVALKRKVAELEARIH